MEAIELAVALEDIVDRQTMAVCAAILIGPKSYNDVPTTELDRRTWALQTARALLNASKKVASSDNSLEPLNNEVEGRWTPGLEEKPVKIVGRGNLGKLDPAYVGDVEAHLEHNPREASRLGVNSPGDLTPDQFLDCFLEWNGIIGYGSTVRRLMTQLGWAPPQEVLAGSTEDRV